MSQPLIFQILINLISPLRVSLRKFFKPVTSQNVPHECLIEEDDNAEVKGHCGMMRFCSNLFSGHNISRSGRVSCKETTGC